MRKTLTKAEADSLFKQGGTKIQMPIIEEEKEEPVTAGGDTNNGKHT